MTVRKQGWLEKLQKRILLFLPSLLSIRLCIFGFRKWGLSYVVLATEVVAGRRYSNSAESDIQYNNIGRRSATIWSFSSTIMKFWNVDSTVGKAKQDSNELMLRIYRSFLKQMRR